VTPSASGYTIVDWITSGSTDELVNYVGYWIPVASPSIKNAEEAALQGLKGRIPILAIYGSKDKGGKVVSERLQGFSDAKVVEIYGGHPCYLDSPDAFIEELLNFLK
jgi:pimeloyl-ACP methyl ester carboxylesterase